MTQKVRNSLEARRTAAETAILWGLGIVAVALLAAVILTIARFGG